MSSRARSSFILCRTSKNGSKSCVPSSSICLGHTDNDSLDDSLDIYRSRAKCHRLNTSINDCLWTARSLRLTCKTFAQNHVICANLFHDIRLYATMESVDAVTALARHAYLNTHVQRIEFMYPVLVGRYCDSAEYMEKVSKEYESLFKWTGKTPYSCSSRLFLKTF